MQTEIGKKMHRVCTDSHQGCPRCQESVPNRVKNVEKCERKQTEEEEQANFVRCDSIQQLHLFLGQSHQQKKAEKQKSEEKSDEWADIRLIPALSAVQSRSRHHSDGDDDDVDNHTDNDGKSRENKKSSSSSSFPDGWMESY